MQYSVDTIDFTEEEDHKYISGSELFSLMSSFRMLSRFEEGGTISYNVESHVFFFETSNGLFRSSNPKHVLIMSIRGWTGRLDIPKLYESLRPRLAQFLLAIKEGLMLPEPITDKEIREFGVLYD